MLLASLGRLKRNILYGFRRELRPYEAAVFERVLAASETKDREALKQQFESRERVQRWTDRVLYFSLPPQHNLPRIEVAALDYCYASVQLKAPDARVTAKFMTHKGLLSTIEFSRQPLPALAVDFTVQRVRLHPGGTGYTEEIQVSEHGPIDA